MDGTFVRRTYLPVSFPFPHIRHLLIDLDGVIYRGATALAGGREFLAWIHDTGIAVRLVTNNATLTPDQYVTKLGSMGIEIQPDEVFTSALATALHLQEQGQQNKSAYVIGQDGLVAALQQIGMRLTDEQPDWVIVGLDRGLTYEKLATAALALERGSGFIGSNPDTSFPTERGLEPGAGALLAAIEATTGRQPLIIGKPRPLMLELAMHQLGGTTHDTAMLGDRLDTDVAAAQAAGMASILVLTGVSKRSDLTDSPYHPSLVVENLSDLLDLWQSNARSPR